MANQSPKPVISDLTVPQNFPTTPTPGKIQILFDANSRELYHRLSPYGYDTFLGIKTRQPWNYTYPDAASIASNDLSQLFTAATNDVQRIANFLASSQGILFLGKQFLLQTGNAFNETRIYNPTSPIVAAGMPLDFWAIRPQRNIDTSNLLGSLLGSVGAGIGSIFSTAGAPPPAGTAGITALPSNNLDAGKGLLRAGTANLGLTNLRNKWAPPSGAGLGLGGFLSGVIKQTFGNFLPQRQDSNTTYRSDEGAYGLMMDGSFMFTWIGPKGNVNQFSQTWVGGSGNPKGIRKDDQLPVYSAMLLPNPDGSTTVIQTANGVSRTVKLGDATATVGFQVADSTLESQPGVRYEDSIGVSVDPDYQASQIMVGYSNYIDPSKQFPSKKTDKAALDVIAVNNSLNEVLSKISTTKPYTVTQPTDSAILPDGNPSVLGYDRLVAMRGRSTQDLNYKYGVLAEYRKSNVRVLENQHTDDIKNKSFKMASSRQYDGINTLTVLDGTKKITNAAPNNGNWVEWNAYKDDIVAFYFYDVVNDKYIPFRNTIRGLQETDSVSWEEGTYIGRADKLYSYGGFNRSLTFSFTVHISSILELAPTWQRINYLMSLRAPASYTRRDYPTNQSGLYSRYIVPPMVMVTIGDLYKNQPLVIGSIGITIPDTALWETLNQDNSDEWSYMVNYIKAPGVEKRYGQYPKTAELSVNAYLLEKERAVVGAASFGHAPHDETYTDGVYRKTPPDNADPSEMSKFLVVYNKQQSTPQPASQG